MTLYICDRCGTQVERDSYGAGNYDISKACADVYSGTMYKRRLKFCASCAQQIEQFLDDEFSNLPATVSCTVNKRD